MSGTVVHVTTLEQWKSVLDVLFEQGYKWQFEAKSYHQKYFEQGQRYLKLHGDEVILQGNYGLLPYIEYADFMAQQEKKMTTYEVTQEQLELLDKVKSMPYPFVELITFNGYRRELDRLDWSGISDDVILKYLAHDETIEFKVKEQLYLLKRTTFRFGPIYFNKMGDTEENDYCFKKSNAFTAPLEEIKKWKTPAWDIEKAD